MTPSSSSSRQQQQQQHASLLVTLARSVVLFLPFVWLHVSQLLLACRAAPYGVVDGFLAADASRVWLVDQQQQQAASDRARAWVLARNELVVRALTAAFTVVLAVMSWLGMYWGESVGLMHLVLCYAVPIYLFQSPFVLWVLLLATMLMFNYSRMKAYAHAQRASPALDVATYDCSSGICLTLCAGLVAARVLPAWGSVLTGILAVYVHFNERQRYEFVVCARNAAALAAPASQSSPSPAMSPSSSASGSFIHNGRDSGAGADDASDVSTTSNTSVHAGQLPRKRTSFRRKRSSYRRSRRRPYRREQERYAFYLHTIERLGLTSPPTNDDDDEANDEATTAASPSTPTSSPSETTTATSAAGESASPRKRRRSSRHRRRHSKRNSSSSSSNRKVSGKSGCCGRLAGGVVTIVITVIINIVDAAVRIFAHNVGLLDAPVDQVLASCGQRFAYLAAFCVVVWSFVFQGYAPRFQVSFVLSVVIMATHGFA